MSIKKRFSIAPDLATGIRNTIQSASFNHGQLHYDMMSVEAIEPDPLNPRKLSVSTHEVLNGLNPSDPDFTLKQKEFDSLNELAESIKSIGIRNAIEVYKDGLTYRIITGERRYLAAIIAKQKTIPVRISQKPDDFNLRYMQWVENINRQDLSLWEKFNNLVLLADTYKSQGEFTEQILQSLLGISNIQAYRYFCLLKADEKIIELIKLRKLNNLKIIQELVSMKDKGARNQIIAWIQSSKDEITSLSAYKASSGKKVSTSRQGKQSIKLGTLVNTNLAKQLVQIILSDSRLEKHRHGFNDIDWTSSKAITKAFKNLFKTIEKELRVEEIT